MVIVLQKLAEILANLKKIREIYNVVFFMQNFMRNSMVHFIKFFRWGEKSYERKRRGRYFAQNHIFTDIFLSVGVRNWRLLLHIA